MKVLSSSPVSSSALKTSPMPSSTEAIMAARSRISSSVPALMPSSTLREASLPLSSKRLGPGRLVLHHLGQRQHVGPAREVRALVEVGMALGHAIAALAEIDRAVGRLEGVGMHRLVGEEQREGLGPRLAQELDGVLVQKIGDVAFVLALIAVDVQHRIDDRAVAREAHPAVVARPRPAANCPCATCRHGRSRSPAAAGCRDSWAGDGCGRRAPRCR